MTRPEVTTPEVGLVYKANAGHQLIIWTQTRITKQRNQTPFLQRFYDNNEQKPTTKPAQTGQPAQTESWSILYN